MLGNLSSASCNQRKRHPGKLVCLCLGPGLKGQKQVVTILSMKHGAESDSGAEEEAGGQARLCGVFSGTRLESRCCFQSRESDFLTMQRAP